MGITKRDKIVEWLVFTLLVIFPFGQLIKIGILSGIDLVAGILLIVYLITKNKPIKIHRYFKNFFFAAVFSLLFSISLFGRFDALFGGLYLLRLVAYYALFVLVWNLPSRVKSIIHSSLFIVLTATAAFGWLQYWLYPDLRALYQWGWDDHLYRLVGTFLDPGFTGILLVFGFLSGLTFYLETRQKKFFLLSLFFLISVAFTYSRASYLAILAGGSLIFFFKKKFLVFALAGVAFLVILFFLPKGVGEGQKLERVASITQRLTNYSETIQIFEKSPLLGVGFNNICLAKEVYLGKIDTTSHACFGSDSSLLLVLADTGIIGFFIFLFLLYKIIRKIPGDMYGEILLGSLVALFIHSFFTNSLFYPWVLAYLAILGGKVYRE